MIRHYFVIIRHFFLLLGITFSHLLRYYYESRFIIRHYFVIIRHCEADAINHFISNHNNSISHGEKTVLAKIDLRKYVTFQQEFS